MPLVKAGKITDDASSTLPTHRTAGRGRRAGSGARFSRTPKASCAPGTKPSKKPEYMAEQPRLFDALHALSRLLAAVRAVFQSFATAAASPGAAVRERSSIARAPRTAQVAGDSSSHAARRLRASR